MHQAFCSSAGSFLRASPSRTPARSAVLNQNSSTRISSALLTPLPALHVVRLVSSVRNHLNASARCSAFVASFGGGLSCPARSQPLCGAGSLRTTISVGEGDF